MQKLFGATLAALLLISAELLTHNYMHGLWGKTLDERFVWTPRDGIEAVSSLSAADREAYLKGFTGLYLGGDLSLPLAYAGAMLLYLLDKRSGNWMLPIIAGTADLVENFGIMYMLRKAPRDLRTDDWLIRIAGTVGTPAKWIFLALGIAACFNAGMRGAQSPATKSGKKQKAI